MGPVIDLWRRSADCTIATNDAPPEGADPHSSVLKAQPMWRARVLASVFTATSLRDVPAKPSCGSEPLEKAGRPQAPGQLNGTESDSQ
jgi:hypothetical protein